MSRIYCDNLKNIVSIQENAFKSSVDERRRVCDSIEGMSLCAWKECLLGRAKTDEMSGKCVCRCPKTTKSCKRGWSEDLGDSSKSLKFPSQGSEFVDLNGDGNLDFAYHFSNKGVVLKGAYLIDPVAEKFISEPKFIPPHAISSHERKDLGARFVDLNGDGKIDVVYHGWNSRTQKQVRGAYINTGEGWRPARHFIPPYPITSDGVRDSGARFVELNGDGFMDFVYHLSLKGKERKGAFINTGKGWAPAPQFTPPYHIADDHGNEGAKFADLNGDGRDDIVYHKKLDRFTIEKGAYINNGQTWIWSPQFTPPFNMIGGRFVDLNGDSKVDLVYHRKFESQRVLKATFINNGYLWIRVRKYTIPTNTDELGVKFVDVNGDGLSDVVWRKGPSEKGAAINTGCEWKRDDKFTPPYNIALPNGKVRFVDLNGDGAVDIVDLSNDKIKVKIACPDENNIV
ncbi:uncharacterized protein LOC114541015 [Dendronephthya gigantea]|uniref:uncharacterized protein LOC114541015 n=1 Tax=Dendronephthya gigantea TaxID=151771 RepID=UPI001069EAEB|nr:uncharacterized protein LOC114541015 [Dendronephthya gigantea]